MRSLLIAAALLAVLFYRKERKQLNPSQAMTLILQIFLMVGMLEFVHHFFIDLGSYSGTYDNKQWQELIQSQVTRLDPAALPHSYRFLPNAIVFWMQILHVKFKAAAEIYRSLTMLVLFYALYRFGRRYTTHLGALIAMLLAAVAYPVSFVDYAGQAHRPTLPPLISAGLHLLLKPTSSCRSFPCF